MHTYTVLGCISAVALVWGIASCSNDETVPPCVTGSCASGTGASGATSSATGTSTASTGAGGDGPCGSETACAPPEPAQPNEMTQMTGVTASVIDQNGSVAPNVNAAICGINVCGDITNSDGNGDLAVNGNNLDFIAARFSLGYNGRGYTKTTTAIPAAPSYDFTTPLRVISLPAFSGGADLVAGQDVTNSNVTLGLAAGSEIKFDCLTFTDPAERKFVATVADVSGWIPEEAPFIDPALNLEVIVALGPLDTHLCPAASLTFPVPVGLGWAAGSDVEIYIHGTKTFAHYAPYGGWAKVADAVVSGDGNTVSTVDGQGIEVLGTYGARLAP